MFHCCVSYWRAIRTVRGFRRDPRGHQRNGNATVVSVMDNRAMERARKIAFQINNKKKLFCLERGWLGNARRTHKTGNNSSETSRWPFWLAGGRTFPWRTPRPQPHGRYRHCAHWSPCWTRNVTTTTTTTCRDCQTCLLHFHLVLRPYRFVALLGRANESFENEVQMDAVVFGPVRRVHR